MVDQRRKAWKLKRQQKGEEEREPTEEELKKEEEEDLKYYEKQNEINKLLQPYRRQPTPPTLASVKELKGFEVRILCFFLSAFLSSEFCLTKKNKQRRLLTTAIGAHVISAALSYGSKRIHSFCFKN